MDVYRFVGDVEFWPASGEVRRGRTVMHLEPQPAAILALLADRAGDLVTHDELRRHIWGEGTHVNFQQGLHYGLRQIRVALGDRAHDPRFVTTVPKRGYRLRADALLDAAGPALAQAAGGSQRSAGVTRRAGAWQRALVLAGFALVMASAIWLVERRPNNHHQAALAVLKTVHGLVY